MAAETGEILKEHLLAIESIPIHPRILFLKILGIIAASEFIVMVVL